MKASVSFNICIQFKILDFSLVLFSHTTENPENVSVIDSLAQTSAARGLQGFLSELSVIKTFYGYAIGFIFFWLCV